MEMQAIEKTLHDVLNAGLGAFGEVTAQAETVKKQVETFYGELVARGAADKSEAVEKLRAGLDQGLAQVKDVQTKVEGALPKKAAQ